MALLSVGPDDGAMGDEENLQLRKQVFCFSKKIVNNY